MMLQRRRQKGRKNIMTCNNNNVVVQQGKISGHVHLHKPVLQATWRDHKKAVQRRLEKQQLDHQKLKKYNNCSSNSGGNITDHHLHHHLQLGMSTSSCSSDQREVMINNEAYFMKPVIKGCLAYAKRSWVVQ
jgi:hypothetical protein